MYSGVVAEPVTRFRLGETFDGNPVFWDTTLDPHLFVGGVVGSGKTTVISNIVRECLKSLQWTVYSVSFNPYGYDEYDWLNMHPFGHSCSDIQPSIQKLAELAEMRNDPDRLPILVVLDAWERWQHADSDEITTRYVNQLVSDGRHGNVHVIISGMSIMRLKEEIFNKMSARMITGKTSKQFHYRMFNTTSSGYDFNDLTVGQAVYHSLNQREPVTCFNVENTKFDRTDWLMW